MSEPLQVSLQFDSLWNLTNTGLTVVLLVMLLIVIRQRRRVIKEFEEIEQFRRQVWKRLDEVHSVRVAMSRDLHDLAYLKKKYTEFLAKHKDVKQKK